MSVALQAEIAKSWFQVSEAPVFGLETLAQVEPL